MYIQISCLLLLLLIFILQMCILKTITTHTRCVKNANFLWWIWYLCLARMQAAVAAAAAPIHLNVSDKYSKIKRKSNVVAKISQNENIAWCFFTGDFYFYLLLLLLMFLFACFSFCLLHTFIVHRNIWFEFTKQIEVNYNICKTCLVISIMAAYCFWLVFCFVCEFE